MHVWAYQHSTGEDDLALNLITSGSTHCFEPSHIAFHEGFAEFAAERLGKILFGIEAPLPVTRDAMQNGFYTDVNATITEAEQTDAVFVTEDWGLQAGNSLRVTVGKKWGDALDLSWETEMNESVTNTFGYTPGYAVHNLRATVAPKEGVWEGTEFRVGVENLFDQNYRTPLMSPGRRATGRNFKVTIAKAF